MERKKGVVEICYQVVLIIYKKMHLWKIPVPGRDRVKTDLSRLYPGENQEERITEYYVRKLTMSLIRRDICAALSKYMDVDAARMEIAVKHQEDTSSERYTTTLYAKLPVHSMRLKGFF